MATPRARGYIEREWARWIGRQYWPTESEIGEN